MEAEQQQVPQVQEAAAVVTDRDTAIQNVLRQANMNDHLLKGIHEVTKAIEAKRAKMVFLANDCDDENYKKVVTGLCREQSLPLILVEEKKDMGVWAGLYKVDKSGMPRNAVPTSCCAVLELWSDSSIDMLKSSS